MNHFHPTRRTRKGGALTGQTEKQLKVAYRSPEEAKAHSSSFYGNDAVDPDPCKCRWGEEAAG